MPFTRFLFILFLLLTIGPSASASAKDKWHDSFYPYRVELTLPQEASGNIALSVTVPDLIDQLKTAAPDLIDIETFSFEKIVLVEPKSQKVVGGFKLALDNQNLIKDSDFSLLGTKDTSWTGFVPNDMKLQPIKTDGHSFNALMITKTAIANSKLSQTIPLDVGSFYLLDYWLYNNISDNNISVQLEDPSKKLFMQLPMSYLPYSTPNKHWTNRMGLARATIPQANFNITHVFIGEAGVGEPRLRKVLWQLIAKLPEKTSKLHLYYVPRAGHKLTCPDEQMILESTTDYKIVKAGLGKAEALNPNPNGVMVKGKYLTAWTVPSDYPLKQTFLQATKPTEHINSKPLPVRLFKGGDRTVLVAIQTDTPHIRFSGLDSDLPVKVRFERLAPIPVYDGPFPKGKLIETRLDAMVAPNDPLAPSSDNGIHLLAATFSASKKTRSGRFTGSLKFTVQTQAPRFETVEIPIELNISPLTINPMKHFAILLSANLLLLRHADHPQFMDEPGLSVTDFHGFPYDARKTDWVTTLSKKEQEELTSNPLIKLARNYTHRLVDFDIQPPWQPLYTDYRYKVTEQGDDKAPILSDWDFTEWDKAINELLIDREVQWFGLWHTNGHLMNRIRLKNGITYGLEPNPKNKLWKQLPEDEYLSLWGNYFNTLAEHLEKKGHLGKVFLMIDESASSTYGIMVKIKREFMKHEYASQIKFAYTNQKTATYTMRNEDGSLVLDEVVDIPMPVNDEHYNFLEPEYNKAFKKPKNHMVYYVESDHLNLINAGMTTMITPLKLGHLGANGWYCWGSFLWSMNYPEEDDGPEFKTGKVINPWLNPFYHHGPGVLSFFYPPDPRGIAEKPTVKVTPSYRLSLMRDGVQARALLEVLSDGKDDQGQDLSVNETKLNQAKAELEKLWTGNPVQWYISYGSYRKFSDLLFEAIEE